MIEEWRLPESSIVILLVIFNPNTKGEERRGSRITSTIMIEEWRLPRIFNRNLARNLQSQHEGRGEERIEDYEHDYD